MTPSVTDGRGGAVTALYRTVRRCGIVLLAALAFLAQAGCGIIWLDYHWRQKITVTVETPDGLRQASAVHNVNDGALREGIYNPGGSGRMRVRGEAVVLEVAPGRYLFALLHTVEDRPVGAVLARTLHPRDSPRSRETLQAIEDLPVGTEVEIAPHTYPLLVTFDDLADPTSVRAVDPNDLAATFGPGHALRSITATPTRERVRTGRVEEVLTWLGEHRNKMLDGRRTHTILAPNRLANDLARGSFVIGGE